MTPSTPSTRRRRVRVWTGNRARQLRVDTTLPERVRWNALKNNQLAGLKFRRQHPIEPFIVDFYCPRLKLAIELDGETHTGTGAVDDQRSMILQQRGVRVIRFTNDQVMHHLEGVLGAIADEAGVAFRMVFTKRSGRTPPHPLPLERGGAFETAPE